MNLAPIVVATIANMALGFLWYSPYLFGNQWIKFMGFTEKSMNEAKKKIGPMYGLATLGALVMAYVLALVLSQLNITTMEKALQITFWLWLGFVMPVQLTEVIFGGKKFQIFFINTGYQLVSIIIMTLILFQWK